MNRFFTASLGAGLALWVSAFPGCASSESGRMRLDPESRRFLDLIGYIVLPVEEKIFQEMPPEDRGDFILDFWGRRDPDPDTPENDYRTTYYERLRTADQAFGRGSPGWKTDRGRIYILLGPPTNVITKTMGDSPNPNKFFGTENPVDAGTLTERPTEIWLYDNYSEYFAGPLRLVFVDYHSTGDFKLQTKEKITAFSMVSPTFDPPNLAKYQWVGEIEMDKRTPGDSVIFDYDASADVAGEGEGEVVRIRIDIPYRRLEYRRSDKGYGFDLSLSAEIRDSGRRVLADRADSIRKDISAAAFRENMAGDLRLVREWTLARPGAGRLVYIGVTDNNKSKRLRKLLVLR